ncbi:MAG: alcohol dehydrogenase catalytic domain-containing protein [bacterium]
MINLSAVLLRPGCIVMREEPMSARLGRGEALLEIECAAVCGTDISIWRGDYPVPLPLVPGHEFVARVVDTHARSPAARLIGRRVVCGINNSCVAYGRRAMCEACRRGLPRHCLRRTVTGIVNHPGAFARYLRAPQGNLHPLPNSIPSDAGTLIEPLAAAMRTFELTPLRGGEIVVVLGCGRLGRLVALAAGRLGARVIAVGRSQAHLDLVAPFAWKRVRLPLQPPDGKESRAAEQENTKSCGHKRDGGGIVSVRDHEQLRAFVLDHTRGFGAGIVVEATGVGQNLLLAQRLAHPMGTIAMKSTSGVPVSDFNTTLAAVDELRFQGSRCGSLEKAIRFMSRHRLPDSGWITARYPLEQTAQAIEAAVTEPKVLVEVRRVLA